VELARSCHYAVRGLVYLGERARQGEPVLLRDIASAIDAPEAFLSKIFQSLRAAGIVRSHRGTSRGYALARDPAQISLYDVIAATEGPAKLHASQIVAEEAGGPFGKVWGEVEELVASRLRSTTIHDLISLAVRDVGPAEPAKQA
jgi:Rrf2 family protein